MAEFTWPIGECALKIFALIAVTIYCGVSLTMAVRLMLLARRTGERPELLIGLAFLTGGMFGYPFSVGANVLLAASRPEAANIAYVVGQTGMACAAFFVLLAWRHIFAAEMKGGRALVVSWTFLLIASLGLLLMTGGPVLGIPEMGAAQWFLIIVQGSCYGLTAWSSASQSRMLARRCALGLADPVVANRLFLWAVSNLAIMMSYLYPLVSNVMRRSGLPNIYDPTVVVAFGLISAGFLTFAFLPPRAYVDKIRANFEKGLA